LSSNQKFRAIIDRNDLLKTKQNQTKSITPTMKQLVQSTRLQLALVGTHSVTGTISSTDYSVDNLIAAYTDQMTTQGIDFTSVPEPSRLMLLLIGACALLRRRQRAPQ
jgi:hypothetical protein